MPNATTISIVGNIIPPELEGKYANWFNEAYAPVFMTIPAMLGIDRYLVIKENPFYPRNIVLYHRQNLQAVQEEISNPDRMAVVRDINTTFKKIEWVWYRKGYELIKSFHSSGQNGEDTRVDNACVMHLEVPRLSPEQEEKFNEWFVLWAYPVYIPILIRILGKAGTTVPGRQPIRPISPCFTSMTSKPSRITKEARS
jgi:hypothetical protein